MSSWAKLAGGSRTRWNLAKITASSYVGEHVLHASWPILAGAVLVRTGSEGMHPNLLAKGELVFPFAANSVCVGGDGMFGPASAVGGSP